MKRILIITLVLTCLLLCSCGGGEMDKLFEHEPNKVSIALDSCTTVDSYKNYLNQTVYPASGYQFKKLLVSITNNYNKSITYSYANSAINYFKAVLGNNHEYLDENGVDNWQIAPGTTVQVTTYFELPTSEHLNGAKLSFVFMDPSNLIYSQKTTITLGDSVDMV